MICQQQHNTQNNTQAVRRQGRAFRRLLRAEDPGALRRLRRAQALLDERLDALAQGVEEEEILGPVPARAREPDWGLGGLLSSVLEEGEAEEGRVDGGSEYQPRLTLGRAPGSGSHHVDDDDAVHAEDEEEDVDDEGEEEEGDEEGEGSASLWGRLTTGLRVRWLLWRHRARYRLRRGSGGGKRYI